jgi:hypothetical protein
MLKIVFTLLITLGLINLSFFQKSAQPILKNDKFFEIKYEELLKQKTTIKLSELATKVEYIQLETSENCLIDNTAKYYFSDNFVFVRNRDHILKFSSDGKFIKQIGTPGRGPGEITSIHTTSIIPEKKWIVLYDYVVHKLRYYNFDGNLLKTVNIDPFQYVKVLKNTNYIAINQVNSVISEKYTHLLIDESGKTFSAVKNSETWKSPNSNGVLTIGSPTFEPFYEYGNKYYLKSLYNDTVYVISNNKIVPAYFINLGKSRIPEEKRFERSGQREARIFWKNTAGYYFAYVFEAGDRLFLTTNEWGGKFNLERFVINKMGFVTNTENRYSGVFKGFIDNDWDGGTLFWPKGSINDNKVFMPVYVTDLKNIIKFRRSSNSLKTMVKFPDKRTQLEKMAAEMNNADNPILMIVTLKTDTQ